MSIIGELEQRNAAYARTVFTAKDSLLPVLKTIVYPLPPFTVTGLVYDARTGLVHRAAA